MFVNGGKGMDNEDQQMTQSWRNLSGKNRNVVGWEQPQQQKQYNIWRWDDKIERYYFYHVGRPAMIGEKSANEKFTRARVKGGA